MNVPETPAGNLRALERLLAERPSTDVATAALARSLAAAIDAQPDVGLAALAKEYRALLKDIASDSGAAPDPFDGLFTEVGDPA